MLPMEVFVYCRKPQDSSSFRRSRPYSSRTAGGSLSKASSRKSSAWRPSTSQHSTTKAEINMALEHSFHESFNGGRGFGALPATREAIDKLNTFIVEEEDGDDEDGAVSCAVCLEDIMPEDLACAMPCSHEYHDGCIRRWLEASRLCPLCRFALE